MRARALTTAATTLTAAVAATTAIAATAGPAAAAPAPTVEWTFIELLPCQGDPGLFQVTVRTRDRVHERTGDGRYHENSTSVGTFVAQPVTVEPDTGDVLPRTGSSWSGRIVLTHTANDGTAGAGHAVSTFGLRIHGSSDAGGHAAQHQLAHYTGTARPDDTGAAVRSAFARSSCS